MKYVITDSSILITIGDGVEIYGKESREYKQLKEYFNLLDDKDNIDEKKVRRAIYVDRIKKVKKLLIENIKISEKLKEKLNDTKNEI